VAELFGYASGQEWGVAHVLLTRRLAADLNGLDDLNDFNDLDNIGDRWDGAREDVPGL
jgi:hypothetical protein